jgi:serine-type D-Ala-D-Ala carboxypeptidase (penicillin-binding protein 5/6)
MKEIKNTILQYKKLLKTHTVMTLFASAVVLFFVVLSTLVAHTSLSRQKASVEQALEVEQKEIEQRLELEILADRTEEKKQEFFSNVSIVGKGAVVYDINNKDILFEKNGSTSYPLASITKVMTVLTAQDILPAGSVITIDNRALATEGESGLVLGEVWNFEDLSDLMLIMSSNDASTAIANAAGERIIQTATEDFGERTALDLFVEEMNKKALEIGMEQAYFKNPSGLDFENETKPSAEASPRDALTLFSYALLEYPSILNHSRFGSHSVVSLNGRNFEAENTNELTRSIPGLLASKTGYTLQAGGNLAVVIDVGFMRPVVIVVLGSTREGRFSDVELLYKITKQYFQAL